MFGAFSPYNSQLTEELVGHYHVRPGHVVYINDSTIFAPPTEAPGLTPIFPKGSREPDVQLRLSLNILDPMLGVQLANMDTDMSVRLTAYTAFFGADLSARVAAPLTNPPRMTQGGGLPLFRELSNQKGCVPYENVYPDSILVVERGECTFFTKLLEARHTGAVGVIVLSDEDLAINPTANADEVEEVGDISDIGLVLLPKTAGRVLIQLMEVIENLGSGQVTVTIYRDVLAMADSAHREPSYQGPIRASEQETEGKARKEDENQDISNPRILYINGHPLLNTRLLV
jgi:mannosidase alpha-like ER degradation enhancer 1